MLPKNELRVSAIFASSVKTLPPSTSVICFFDFNNFKDFLVFVEAVSTTNSLVSTNRLKLPETVRTKDRKIASFVLSCSTFLFEL